jgi:hypothetical protein
VEATIKTTQLQLIDANIRRAELDNEPLPTFEELESLFLNIDDTRGLTILSQQQRHSNQHAHSTRHNNSPNIPPQRDTYQHFTQRQLHPTQTTRTIRQIALLDKDLLLATPTLPKTTPAKQNEPKQTPVFPA